MISYSKISLLARFIFCVVLVGFFSFKVTLAQVPETILLPACNVNSPLISKNTLSVQLVTDTKALPQALEQYLIGTKYQLFSTEINVANPFDEKYSLVISFDELEGIFLAEVNETSSQQLYQTGIQVANQSKNITSPIINQHLIRLQLPPQATQKMVLYVLGIGSKIEQVSVAIQCAEAYQLDYQWHLWVQAFFLGVLSLFAVMLLFIYLNNGLAIYLYLFSYCFLLIISSFANFNHFTSMASSTALDYLIWAISSQCAAIFLIEFFRKALEVALYSTFFDKLLKFLTLTRVFTLLMSVYVFITGSEIWLTNQSIIYVDISNILLAFWLLIHYILHGNTFARYLAASTILLVLGLLCHITYHLGYFQESLGMPYFFQAGLVGQVCVICFGLGLQLKASINNERKAQAKVLVLQKEINTRLELKVKERTEALEKVSKDVQLRNDELSQQQEEIISINNHLEELVEIRTLEIKKQNELLRNYAYFNAHKVRGPLARILGLIYLVKIEPPQATEQFFDFILQLEVCANELDTTIKEINDILSDDDDEYLEEDTSEGDSSNNE